MSEIGTPSSAVAEAVGQDGPHQSQNKSGFGGFLKANAVVWMFVIALALAFVVVIIVAAARN